MIQAIAFTLTLLLEVPAGFAYRYARRIDVRIVRLLAVAVLATSITHPLVWALVSDWLRPLGFWSRAAIAEPIAVAVEALVYARLTPMPWRDAIAVSILANLFSFTVGYLMREQIFALARALH